MQLKHLITRAQVLPYLIVGTIATALDWCTFAMMIEHFSQPYPVALCAAYLTAGLFHYLANKIITFKCKSKKILAQLLRYGFVGILSLGCSLILITMLIKITPVTELSARIITTLLMLIPNYLLHKYISYRQ
jgi:putative flippase GtrA